MERIERVWLLPTRSRSTPCCCANSTAPACCAQRRRLKAWLPVEPGGKADDHVYLIDPLGNLMMRFPKDADPSKVKKDIAKLLKASAIG
jgi:hypothetical protein